MLKCIYLLVLVLSSLIFSQDAFCHSNVQPWKGEQGLPGLPGLPGDKGPPGANGADGRNGIDVMLPEELDLLRRNLREDQERIEKVIAAARKRGGVSMASHAIAIALAGVPDATTPRRPFSIGVSIGEFSGTSAAAIGMDARIDGRLGIRAGFSTDSQMDQHRANIGVTLRF